MFVVCFVVGFFFKTGFPCVRALTVLDGLEFTGLPLPPELWDQRCAPPHPAAFSISIVSLGPIYSTAQVPSHNAFGFNHMHDQLSIGVRW